MNCADFSFLLTAIANLLAALGTLIGQLRRLWRDP
jgi:hypothetical protein